MRKRVSKREILSVEWRAKRGPLASGSATKRQLRIDAERFRGVLAPILRGCSEPRWLRDA